MRPCGGWLGRWVWLPAAVCAAAGIAGLADLREADVPGKVVLVAPHLAGVALAAWAGRRRLWAGAVALGVSALMAALSWWDALDRQTEGIEWRFNNALSGSVCCAANWLVLWVAWLALCVATAGRSREEKAAAVPSLPEDAGERFSPRLVRQVRTPHVRADRDTFKEQE